MKKKIFITIAIIVLVFIGFKIHSPHTKIIAHRGASGYKMEHTFQSYDLAKKSTKYIEQDVVLSKDGTLYVSHDLTPYRVTRTEKRAFNQLTDSEVNKLKTKKTSSSHPEHIHTLQSIVDKYGKNITYVIELKGREKNIANIATKFILKNHLQSHVIIQSFNLSVLHQVKDSLPSVKTMYLLQSYTAFRRGISDSKVDIIAPSNKFLCSSYINKAHKAKKEICFWTLNSPKEMNTAIKYKVDYFFTNYPDIAYDHLRTN